MKKIILTLILTVINLSQGYAFDSLAHQTQENQAYLDGSVKSSELPSPYWLMAELEKGNVPNKDLILGNSPHPQGISHIQGSTDEKVLEIVTKINSKPDLKDSYKSFTMSFLKILEEQQKEEYKTGLYILLNRLGYAIDHIEDDITQLWQTVQDCTELDQNYKILMEICMDNLSSINFHQKFRLLTTLTDMLKNQK